MNIDLLQIKYDRLSVEEKKHIIDEGNILLANFYKECKYTRRENYTFLRCEPLPNSRFSAPRTNEMNDLFNDYKIGYDDTLRGLLDLTKVKFHSDFSWLMDVVDKIESLDMSEFHYKWIDDGKERSNFMNISVDISHKQCWIFIELELDPPFLVNQISAQFKYKSKIEAVWCAIVEFVTYYNKKKGI